MFSGAPIGTPMHFCAFDNKFQTWNAFHLASFWKINCYCYSGALEMTCSFALIDNWFFNATYKLCPIIIYGIFLNFLPEVYQSKDCTAHTLADANKKNGMLKIIHDNKSMLARTSNCFSHSHSHCIYLSLSVWPTFANFHTTNSRPSIQSGRKSDVPSIFRYFHCIANMWKINRCIEIECVRSASIFILVVKVKHEALVNTTQVKPVYQQHIFNSVHTGECTFSHPHSKP